MNPKYFLRHVIAFQLYLLLFASFANAQPLTARTVTANSYLQRGNESFAKGDYARAEADFALAIISDPAQSEAYFNRGIVRYQLGKRQEVLADFDRALQRAPKMVEA
jgi:tetratricopeptide (TPR) repeat protein